MSFKVQQIALNNALVAQENQRVIGKCNTRINPGMKPKESTYQVVLDALALTTCYHAFLITAEVPVIYMHPFRATVNKHKASYRFKIDNKKFSVNVEVFREIINICPRIPGTDTTLGVPDVPKYLSESENESWGDSDDNESNDDNSDEVIKDDDEDDVESDANDDNEASDSENIDSNKDENLNLNLKDDEEEEKEEEDVRSPDSFEFNNDDEEYDELYKDVNVRSTVAEHEEVGKGDAEMTDTTHESASQEKFLNLDNVPPIIDEVASMMNVKTPHEELSIQAPPNLSVPVMATSSYTTEFEKKAQAEKEKYIDIIEKSVKEIIKDEKILLDKLEKSKSYRAAEQHRDLYDALVKSYQLDKDLFDSYGKTYSLKRGREDKDKDEDPPAGPDQWLKKRKTSKDVEPSRGSKSKESKSSSSKGSKSQSKSSGKSA
ncbi:hypothetical protein Tco_0863669 [Tanacetum coccineum]